MLQLTGDPRSVAMLQRLVESLRGRYEIEQQIGRGGAAYVFRANDLRRDRIVALKVMRPELTAALGEARFRREIDVARKLDHPNILSVFEFGVADGVLYFTMPYVDGGTLRDKIRRERQLPLPAALKITREIAAALDYSHARGVVHRDIKPANILLLDDRAVLADFGIARAMTVAAGAEITESGMAVGTPEYMSPEQGSGRRDLDARTDVYSLGCVLYEMIAGEPPFTGPTAQAIVARHCMEPPRSIRVIRPSLPAPIEEAIMRALAKVPADRFPTAREFVDAAENAPTAPAPAAKRSPRARVILAAAGGIMIVAGAAAFLATNPTLDPNRIVVFPLNDPSSRSSATAGEDVATFIGYALDGTRPLKWLDGWELLQTASPGAPARLTSETARKLSRRARAAYYIDGSIIRRADSVTVILRLHDIGADSVLGVEGRSGPAATASLPQLGLEAIRALLPDLLAPGGQIDLSALSSRRPPAVANFLQGERAYRRMQFRAALPHYKAAVHEDSAFMLAALRGAQTANWLSDFDNDIALAKIALRDVSSLPTAQAEVARGLHAYLTGAADSAVVHLNRAVRSDTTAYVAWTLLGEVYSRLLPHEYRSDSLAADALQRARRADRDFAPTLVLLEERALREGDVRRALTLREELRHAGADTTHLSSRRLMLQCVRDGPESVDWNQAARENHLITLASGSILGGRASQPECALGAFASLLRTETAPASVRWAAVLGTLGQFAAARPAADMKPVLSTKGTADLPIPLAYLLVAAAGRGFDREAAIVADSAARRYRGASAARLWFLAAYEGRRGNLDRLRDIAGTLDQMRDSSRSRSDSLLSLAVQARVRLADGDSGAAVLILKSLRPTGTRHQIMWEPWESLGPERLLLAELLLARGEYEEARRVASQLDATEPLIYPLYLRTSLELRIRSANALRQTQLAAGYLRRLQRLG